MIRRMALAHAAGSVKVPAKPESEGQKSLGISRGQEMFEACKKFKFKNCEIPGRCLVLDTSKQMPARLTAMFVMKSDLDGC